MGHAEQILKEIIDKEGMDYLRKSACAVYHKLEAGKVAPVLSRLILITLLADIPVKAKEMSVSDLSKEIQKQCCLKKGISDFSPEIISRHFDEANFLFGISGQTRLSMERDIELGLKFFERICINVMCENSTPVKPDKTVIDTFLKYIYPRIEGNERVDVLLSNTDFGVG